MLRGEAGHQARELDDLIQWLRKAELAVDRGQDDLARAALDRLGGTGWAKRKASLIKSKSTRSARKASRSSFTPSYKIGLWRCSSSRFGAATQPGGGLRLLFGGTGFNGSTRVSHRAASAASISIPVASMRCCDVSTT